MCQADDVLSFLRAVLYMVLKISNVWERGQLLVVSAKALAQSQASYGKAVSPAELCEIGNQCSICQASGESCTPRPVGLMKHCCCRTHVHMSMLSRGLGDMPLPDDDMLPAAGGVHTAAEAVLQPRLLRGVHRGVA